MGFSRNRDSVAMVHKAPYVDLYHFHRRPTLPKVPRHSPFLFFFWGKPELHNFYNIDTMGRRRPWPLYCHPRLEDARSEGRRLLPTSWATPHPLGSFQFIQGGEISVASAARRWRRRSSMVVLAAALRRRRRLQLYGGGSGSALAVAAGGVGGGWQWRWWWR